MASTVFGDLAAQEAAYSSDWISKAIPLHSPTAHRRAAFVGLVAYSSGYVIPFELDERLCGDAKAVVQSPDHLDMLNITWPSLRMLTLRIARFKSTGVAQSAPLIRRNHIAGLEPRLLWKIEELEMLVHSNLAYVDSRLMNDERPACDQVAPHADDRGDRAAPTSNSASAPKGRAAATGEQVPVERIE